MPNQHKVHLTCGGPLSMQTISLFSIYIILFQKFWNIVLKGETSKTNTKLNFVMRLIRLNNENIIFPIFLERAIFDNSHTRIPQYIANLVFIQCHPLLLWIGRTPFGVSNNLYQLETLFIECCIWNMQITIDTIVYSWSIQ